jgi:hypothetical protein
MLIPYLQLPAVVKYDPNNKDLRHFFDFIDRISLLGFVMLNIDSAWDRTTGMFELMKIVQSNPMFMSGFIVHDLETAGYLLDKGLRVAFFTAPHRDSKDVASLSRLPRTRIGINCVALTTTAQIIVDTIETYYTCAAHFIFRFVFVISIQHCFYNIITLIKHYLNVVEQTLRSHIVSGS